MDSLNKEANFMTVYHYGFFRRLQKLVTLWEHKRNKQFPDKHSMRYVSV